MPTGKKHKSQHWVPATYLQAWCDPHTPAGHTPFIWSFQKDGACRGKRAPKNAFEETDFYTLTDTSGERDLAVEQYLSRIESEFRRVRDDVVLQRLPLSGDDRGWLLTFMAAAHHRTKAQKNHLAGQWQDILDLVHDIEAAVDAMTPEERMVAAASSIRPAAAQEIPIDVVQELAAQPMAALPTLVRAEWKVMSRMGLTLCWAEEGDIGFVTTDRPCFLFDAKDRRPFPPALGYLTAEVTMAITPRCMALVTWANAGSIDTATFPPSAVDIWNRRAIRHCAETFVVRGERLRPEWFSGPDMPFVTVPG